MYLKKNRFKLGYKTFLCYALINNGALLIIVKCRTKYPERSDSFYYTRSVKNITTSHTFM